MAAYLPRHVAAAAAGPELDGLVGKPHHLTGVVLFADVAGFTPMSEALAAHGRRGTEDLTRCLNSFFETTVGLIHPHGGEVVRIAGDAVTAFFPAGATSLPEVAERGLACAVEMQAVMPQFRSLSTVAGRFTLTVKVGLAVGPVVWMVVGDPSLRLEHVLVGGPVDDAADAEHHASGGQIVVHRDVLPLVENVRAEQLDEGFSLLRSAPKVHLPPPMPSPISEVPEKAWPFVLAFLHPLIAERLTANRAAFINEHREVTTVFAAFPGLDYGGSVSAADTLQRLMTQVTRVADRFGGHLAQVDIGDKGSKFLLFFGAPVLHEDDPERAVRCVAELLRVDDSLRIGITTGRVFSGEVGSVHRREYLVMGDWVNLAARLMQAAKPGQVLVDSAVRERAPAFPWSARGPLAVKGKAHPVEAWSLFAGVTPSDEVRERAYDTPLVGRRNEVRRVLRCLDQAARSEGNIVAVIGEPGVGKSRLVAEVERIARLRGFHIFRGDCRSYDTAVTYLPWRGIFRAILGIEAGTPVERQRQQIGDYLSSMGEGYMERAPLLAPVLNLSMEDTKTTASLDPELRWESLCQLLLDCLRHAADARRTLLVLEDCHWIDPLSASLLAFLARNVVDERVTVLLTWRQASGQDPGGQVLSLPHSVEIRLLQLSRAEAKKLLILELQNLFGADLRPASPFLHELLDRAQGNPLYIEELARFAHLADIDPGSGIVSPSVFPDSLEALIMARIDGLADAERTTLKVASVVGRVFKAAWVSGSYPEVGPLSEVLVHFDALSAQELTALHRRKPEVEFSFKHPVTQDVAYQSLTFANRELLHGRIAHYIESAYPSLDHLVEELAHHYSHTTDRDKQRFYLRRAGEKAKSAFANEAAADYFERLLELSSTDERTEVLVGLGDVRLVLGQWSQSQAAYEEALRQAAAQHDSRRIARAQAALGYLLTYTKSLAEAITLLRGARQKFVDLSDVEGLTRTLDHLGHAAFFLGDYRGCIAHSRELLRLGESTGDRTAMSTACGNLGRAHWRLGELDAALEYLNRALELAAEAGYQKGVIHANSDIAGLHAQMGNPAAALSHLGQALHAARRVGYQLIVSVAVGNAGILYRESGDYRRASACFEQSLAMALELGHWPGICNMMMELGRLLTSMKRYVEAHRALLHSVDISRRLNLREFECASLLYYAELLFISNRAEESVGPVRQALRLAGETGDREIKLAAEVLDTRIAAALGRVSSAEGAARLEAMLQGSLQPVEKAQVHYALWRLDVARAASRRAASRLYRALYEESHNVEYADRCKELTGQSLPPPSPLPDLRGVKGRGSTALPALLQRVDALVTGLSNERSSDQQSA